MTLDEIPNITETLNSFLEALVFLFITDESAREMCTRCGIWFKKLPRCFATEIGEQAQKIATFDLAKHEMSQSAAFLERTATDLRQIPSDDNAFLQKLNALLEDQRVYELCRHGLIAPRIAREKIKNFQEAMTSEVSYGSLDGVMSVYLAEWHRRVNQGEALIKIPEFEKLSGMIGGFNPGRVGMLLAETGFGKTNLGLSLALKSRIKMPTAYVNMEMSLDDIAKRVTVLETKISHKEFFESVKIKSFIETKWPIGKGFFITDGQGLSPNQIKGWVRSLSKENPIGFVVVDYDQCLELQTSRDTPEWKALQNALTDFDNFSREMNCFVLVLAQLNRDGDISASHRSTFKAHTVLHFRNDDEHGPIIQAKKNRHGKAGAALRLRYEEHNSSITEIEEIYIGSKKKPKREITVRQKEIPNYARGIK